MATPKDNCFGFLAERMTGAEEGHGTPKAPEAPEAAVSGELLVEVQNLSKGCRWSRASAPETRLDVFIDADLKRRVALYAAERGVRAQAVYRALFAQLDTVMREVS